MLREALERLSDNEKARLFYALEQELTAWIALPESFFIGVHIRSVPSLTIMETQGVWSYGKVT